MALQQGEKFGCGTLRAIALLVLVRVRSSHTPSTRSPGPKVSTSPGCIAVRPQIGAGRSPATRENRRALPVRWRPPRAALRELRHLYQAAVRRDEARSDVLADLETAHGLEQQLTHALVECLGNGTAIAVRRRDQAPGRRGSVRGAAAGSAGAGPTDHRHPQTTRRLSSSAAHSLRRTARDGPTRLYSLPVTADQLSDSRASRCVSSSRYIRGAKRKPYIGCEAFATALT